MVLVLVVQYRVVVLLANIAGMVDKKLSAELRVREIRENTLDVLCSAVFWWCSSGMCTVL